MDTSSTSGWQVLDVTQQLLQALPVPGTDRGELEPAVPDQDGGDPLCLGIGSHSGSQKTVGSKCVWMSMNPGVT